jgi:hypothetical protein
VGYRTNDLHLKAGSKGDRSVASGGSWGTPRGFAAVAGLKNTGTVAGATVSIPAGSGLRRKLIAAIPRVVQKTREASVAYGSERTSTNRCPPYISLILIQCMVDGHGRPGHEISARPRIVN